MKMPSSSTTGAQLIAQISNDRVLRNRNPNIIQAIIHQEGDMAPQSCSIRATLAGTRSSVAAKLPVARRARGVVTAPRGLGLVPAVQRSSLDTRMKAFILEPTGTGDCAHVEGEFPPAQPVSLPDSGTVEVGRSGEADVILPPPTVSGRHALVKVAEGQVMVTDLGSTNGTFIDGVELDSMVNYPLEFGSEVVFGDEFLCRFMLLDDASL